MQSQKVFVAGKTLGEAQQYLRKEGSLKWCARYFDLKPGRQPQCQSKSSCERFTRGQLHLTAHYNSIVKATGKEHFIMIEQARLFCCKSDCILNPIDSIEKPQFSLFQKPQLKDIVDEGIKFDDWKTVESCFN